MIFDVRVSSEEAWEILHVVGEVDLATAPLLRGAILGAVSSAVGRGDGLAVDLTACDFIDSVGLGVLLGGFRRTRAAGLPFAVVVGDARVRSTFERCRLDEILTLVDDRTDLAVPGAGPEAEGRNRWSPGGDGA